MHSISGDTLAHGTIISLPSRSLLPQRSHRFRRPGDFSQRYAVLWVFIFLIIQQFVYAKGTTFRSGSYAHRAKIQWQEGNYSAGHALYRSALSESIKEANIVSEGLIKLNMANMELDAMRLGLGQDYIESIPLHHNSKALRLQTLILQLQLQQVRGDCESASQKLTKYMKEHRNNEDLNLRIARVPLAICFASLGKKQKASNQLNWAKEEYDEGAKGMRAYGRAWIEMKDNNWTQAIQELHLAFDYAQRSVRPYDLGYILFYIGYCYERLDRIAMAAQFYKRSFLVYQKIQLARPTMRSLKRFLDIVDNSKLRQSLLTLEGRQSVDTMELIYRDPPF